MHLTLHIGTEKTGTTSIQNFLSINRALLGENGVIVPRSLGGTNQRLLAGIAMNDDHVDDLFQSAGLTDDEARHTAKADWFSQFRRELDAKADGADMVLISSEHLHSRLSRDGEIERLHELLSPLFESITVVVYLREPIATAVSAYSTAVKYGAIGANIPPPDRPYFFNLVNHARTTRRWSGVFGDDALRVRLFEPDALLGGEAISDFIETAKLPQLNYAMPLRSNPSLDALGVELLRRVNKDIPRFVDAEPNPLREGLIEFFEKHFSDGSPIAAPAKIVAAYEETFADSNAFIHQTYFPERNQLFTPYSKAAERPHPGHVKDYDAVASALTSLWRAKQEAMSQSALPNAKARRTR